MLGPSRHLPTGPLLTNLKVANLSELLVGASTDRADFYHQVLVSNERARSNCVGTTMALRDFAGTKAHARLLDSLRSRSSLSREQRGDLLNVPPPEAVLPSTKVAGCFASLFQGDHGGVEFATAAHEGLLCSWDLLHPSRRLSSAAPAPLKGPWEALVIDDYFALSAEPIGLAEGLSGRGLSDALRSSAAASCVLRAKAAYSAEDLNGSDHKDVLGSLSFRAAGAHVDSSIESVRDGLVLIGAAPEKRLALAWISLKAACLPQISEELASALAGSLHHILHCCPSCNPLSQDA